MHYEILRKIGKRILQNHTGDSEDESLVDKFVDGLQKIRRPEYRAYFGCSCPEEEEGECRGREGGRECEMVVKWTPVKLRKEIADMLGISLKNLQHERHLKFILALVKSERYTAAEMYAIIRVSRCQNFCYIRIPRILTRSLSLRLPFLPLTLSASQVCLSPGCHFYDVYRISLNPPGLSTPSKKLLFDCGEKNRKSG